MNNITTKGLLETIDNLKKLVKEAWHAGYEQSMEDNFHEREMQYEQSLFYSENKESLQ